MPFIKQPFLFVKKVENKTLKNKIRTSKTFNRLHNVPQPVNDLKSCCPIILQWFDHTKDVLNDTIQYVTTHFDSMKTGTQSQGVNKKQSAKKMRPS